MKATIGPRELAKIVPQLRENEPALTALAAASPLERVERGGQLMCEGADESFLIGVVEGEVAVQRRLGEKRVTLAVVGPWSLLGETALLVGERRMASVVANTRVTYCRIPVRAFQNALMSSLPLAVRLLRDAMARLRQSDERYIEALKQRGIRQEQELARLRGAQLETSRPDGVWGPSLDPLLRRARQLARSDLPVLIRGESGTGKELIASFIHEQSGRADQELCSLNCAAIPEKLAEAELFGVRQGAYTGADRDRPGLLRRADGGTLFLDEIGDLSLSVQAKLLRALQDGTYYAVGSQELERGDVRLVSATNKDLAQAVSAGEFREDLLHRIWGSRIELPPLRDRREDIPALVEWVVRECLPDEEPGYVVRDVLPVLAAYDWPGNIRELIAVVKEAITVAERFPRLQVGDLRREVLESSALAARERFSGTHAALSVEARLAGRSLREHLQQETSQLIRLALAEADGVRKEAAALLGMSPQNLSNHMNRLGMTRGGGE